jgi:hypothetical protein
MTIYRMTLDELKAKPRRQWTPEERARLEAMTDEQIEAADAALLADELANPGLTAGHEPSQPLRPRKLR